MREKGMCIILGQNMAHYRWLKIKIDWVRNTLVFEVVFSILAVVSVALLIYENVASLSTEEVQNIVRIDFWIATMFLIDYCAGQYLARDNWKYFKSNWYMLLASIPINEYAFRSLRILRIFRAISALSRTTYIPEFIPRWKQRLGIDEEHEDEPKV